MEEEYREEEQPKPNMPQTIAKALGGGMTKDRRNQIYFGREPHGLHPKHKSLEHIHDIGFSPEQISRLYGLPPKETMAMDSVSSDTRKDLIMELMEKGLTRRSAEETVDGLIQTGLLVEQYDKDSNQKMLVRR